MCVCLRQESGRGVENRRGEESKREREGGCVCG